MFNISDLIVIHIVWEGPFTAGQAANRNTEDDYGVYRFTALMG